MAQVVSRWPRFVPRSVHVGYVVDEVALGQVFSEFFGFPLSISSFHHGSPYSYIWWMNNRPQFRDIVSPHRHEQHQQN
jgi:hypothetical protein